MSSPQKSISPELKAMFQSWVKLQDQKYGSDWKRILAAEMTAKTIKDFGLPIQKIDGEKK